MILTIVATVSEIYAPPSQINRRIIKYGLFAPIGYFLELICLFRLSFRTSIFFSSTMNYKKTRLMHQLPKGDLWVQSPMIIVGQSPNNRSIAENRRRSAEAYRRVMSTWPSMMVGTAKGDLPKLFSPALLA